MSQQNLIVPLNIQACCLGGSDAAQQNFIPKDVDFSELPYAGDGKSEKANLSINILNGPFTGSVSMESGIHLHWALPSALMNGNRDSLGKMKFPSAPNRWLVTRLAFDESSQLINESTQSWIVESDFLQEAPTNPNDTNVPYEYGKYEEQPFRYMGTAVPLSQWLGENSQNTYYPNFTGIGYGNITFASLYQNCRSVFGFYDNASGLSASSLTYCVVGWYSDEQNDFINTVPAGEDIQGWLAIMVPIIQTIE